MAKVTITTLANLDNPPSATATINNNFAELQDVIETLLSRDGTSPNTMTAVLDMNSNRVINLPVPQNDTDAARHGDLQTYVDDAESARDTAVAAKNVAVAAEADAEAAAGHFKTYYLGGGTSDPSVDDNGDPLVAGALYFNENDESFRAYSVDVVFVGNDEVQVSGETVDIRRWTKLPANTLKSLSDTDVSLIADDQIIKWNAGSENFEAVDYSATAVSYDDSTTDLNSVNVQAALEEIISRTSLGVYDISFWVQDKMEDGEDLFHIVASRDFTLPVSLTNSVAVAGTAANNETIVIIKKNGTQIGTVTWAASGTAGSFSFAGEVSFTSGDTLEFQAPSPPDTALADVSITIAATR